MCHQGLLRFVLVPKLHLGTLFAAKLSLAPMVVNK